MKVNITCMDCEITIEEIDGQCIVTAQQDGEVVEEFTVDHHGSSDDDVDVDDVDVDDVDDVDVETHHQLDDEEEIVDESVKTYEEFMIESSDDDKTCDCGCDCGVKCDCCDNCTCGK